MFEDSISPYNHPILLVPKKRVDELGKKKFRLCVNFQKLNKICQPYAFPIPRIADIVDHLREARHYSTLYLSQGFHHVLIQEEAQEKTAFSTGKGHY